MRMPRLVLSVACAAAVAACAGNAAPAAPTPGPAAPSTTTAATATAATATSAGSTVATQDATAATAATAPPATAPAGPWTVDTASCPDPAAASAPITGTLAVVAAAPLTGGVAAARWKPVVDGLRTAIDHANATQELGDLHVALTVVDDRYDPDRTEDAVQAELDKGAQAVVGAIGTGSNLALRFTLNEQCIPQLLGISGAPQLDDPADFPWTTGALATPATEVAVLGTLVRSELPGGGTVGLYAADGPLGDAYVAAASRRGAAGAGLGLDVVATERVAADAALPATASVERLVAARPDVVLAAPEGLDCTWFLRELARQRSAAPDWQPVVLLAAGCATDAALGLAGPAADGVYATAALVDLANQANAELPGVHEYEAWVTAAGLGAEAADAVEGWTVGEAFVAIVRQAMAAPGGLSRRALIEAARAVDLTPSLGRPGVQLRTNGVADPFLVESMQVIRWRSSTRGFVDVGPVVTAFES